MMKFTKIYADENGDTHFEDIMIPLHDKGVIGFLSEKYPVKSIEFRENKADYDWDFHTAPVEQFIVLLNGQIEIETSLGEKRIFAGGDILLVQDTTGKGHRTKNTVKQKRQSIFIQL